MEAAPRPRVERKGRFIITDISPVSPVAGAAPAPFTVAPPPPPPLARITSADSQTPPTSPAAAVDQKELNTPLPPPPPLESAPAELEPEPSPVATDAAHQHQALSPTAKQEASEPVVVVMVPTPTPTPIPTPQLPSGRESESPTASAAPVAPFTKPSLTIEVGTGAAVATTSPDTRSVESARSFPSTPSQHEQTDIARHADDEQRAAERRVIRKSRFTITDLDSPVSRENSDGFFSQNYSTSSSMTYSAELPQTDLHVPAAYEVHEEPTSSQDFGQQPRYFRPQPQQQLGRVPFQSAEMGVQHRPITRSRSTPQKQRSRESRRMRMRTISPIHLKLEMSDLTHDPSGSSLQQTTSYSSSNGYTDDLGYSGAYYSQSSSSTSVQSNSGLFSNGTVSERRQENGSGGGRRSASSRQKSITVSATQFLQQQQTIAALIRQQQELKRVVTILQEQQQQLMRVPVQLHELQIENAKEDGKDEMMRELYVQVDSLMHANESLKVLLTQTEKEAQDRALEVEFLTEENDQLHARCRYFERKYIEERKLTFVLEEEVQRFRMVSLTHELEQRNSTSQESP